MGHAVHYRTSSGETRFEEAESLDAALAKVERLRNEGGVSDVRVFREVPIAFKAYYKVTVAEGDEATAGDTPEPAPTSAPPTAPAAVDTPPPGAMPLTPSGAHATPPAAPAEAVATEDADADAAPAAEAEGKRASLFSRG
jgi:hypothetical protein